MTVINPFLQIRGELEETYSRGEQDLCQFLWEDQDPPKKEILDLLEEYHSRLLHYEHIHGERPTLVAKRATIIKNSANKLMKNLYHPVAGPEPFRRAWFEANGNDIDNEDLLFLLYVENIDETVKGITKIIKACDLLLTREPKDRRKNLSTQKQWLAAELEKLFFDRVKADRKDFEESADFVSEVGRIFGIKLPETTRSLRTARKKISD